MILWFQGTGGGAVLYIVFDLITAEEKEWMSLFFFLQTFGATQCGISAKESQNIFICAHYK